MGKAFNHSMENLLMWIPPASQPEVALEGQITIFIPQIPFPFIDFLKNHY